MFDEKAQLHTLEGVGAAMLILFVIIYAIDATSMTPQTSSTSSIHVESELAVLGQDLLNTLDYAEPGYNSKLKNDVIKWDGKQYLWNGTKYMLNANATYAQNNLTNNMTEIFNTTLIRQGIAHKVELRYLRIENNDTKVSTPVEWIYAGVPSSNTVIVSRKIVLQDTDNVSTSIPDIDPSSNLHNIVEIRLFLWRS